MRRSLAQSRPTVARMWHPWRNAPLTPDDVSSGSKRRVWWKCPKAPDHEWQGAIVDRRRHGCPFCAGNFTARSGSIVVLDRRLAREFHPTKNGALRPEQIGPHSNRKTWWRCSRDSEHEWMSNANQRTLGHGCPFCARLRIIPGGPECLARISPRLARQWNSARNDVSKTPATVYGRTTVDYWWRCDKGADHEWKESPGRRLSDNLGCPFCSGSRVSITTSLAARSPEIAGEWHPSRNGALTPHDVTVRSARKVVWRCRKKPRHIWTAEVWRRAYDPRCPFCAHIRPSSEYSLVTVAPKIAAQWHPLKNGALRAKEVLPHSTKRVWWKCRKGPDHEWESTITERTADHSGCPFCSNRRLSVTNSLAALYPRLASEWHPTWNGKATAHTVMRKYPKPAWWRCRKGHVWRVMVATRAYRDMGCPICRGPRKQRPATTRRPPREVVRMPSDYR